MHTSSHPPLSGWRAGSSAAPFLAAGPCNHYITPNLQLELSPLVLRLHQSIPRSLQFPLQPLGLPHQAQVLHVEGVVGLRAGLVGDEQLQYLDLVVLLAGAGLEVLQVVGELRF